MDTCVHCSRVIDRRPVRAPNGLMHQKCARRIGAIAGTLHKSLVLQLLCNTMPDLAPAFGRFMSDCASICFEDQGHRVGQPIEVVGGLTDTFRAYWKKVNNNMRRTYLNEQVVTENGACGVAILVINNLTKHKVVEQSAKDNGFDFWLGEKGRLPFDKMARLEVSGIRHGNDTDINARRAEKIAQTMKSDYLQLDAYVVIIEFSKPVSDVTFRPKKTPRRARSKP